MAHVVVLGAGPGPMPRAQETKAQRHANDGMVGEPSVMSALGVATLETRRGPRR
jgi:hypothetical protein